MIALVIVTIISGLATGFGLFYRLIYILILTAVLSFVWNWVSMLGLDISVDRRTKRARVGDDIEERITIRNHIPLPKPTLEVEDVTDLPGYSSGQALSLSSRGFRSWRTISPARKRGVYTLGPVRVSNSDAFGLFRRDADFGESDSLVVYPRTYNLSDFEIPATYLTGESNARRRSHDLTPHAASVREYASGDSLSRIHWNSTARTQRLMSKEFDLGLSSDVWLMVDLHAEVQAGELEDSTDEYAVSIAASSGTPLPARPSSGGTYLLWRCPVPASGRHGRGAVRAHNGVSGPKQGRGDDFAVGRTGTRGTALGNTQLANRHNVFSQG